MVLSVVPQEVGTPLRRRRKGPGHSQIGACATPEAALEASTGASRFPGVGRKDTRASAAFGVPAGSGRPGAQRSRLRDLVNISVLLW
jgi:hypothetical protein